MRCIRFSTIVVLRRSLSVSFYIAAASHLRGERFGDSEVDSFSAGLYYNSPVLTDSDSFNKMLPVGLNSSPEAFTHRSVYNQRNLNKPFRCEYCSKPFAQKFHLNQHRRLHTGERPFKCYSCDKSYTSKNKLVDHCRQFRHLSDVYEK